MRPSQRLKPTRTLRTLPDQIPSSPHGMLALYRLGAGYADNDQWEMAARAWTDLANRYRESPNDASAR